MSGNLMREAMACQSQVRADALLEVMAGDIREAQPDLSMEAAVYTARQRIGYHAGHMTHDIRERVERLFKTAHPIFGAIRYNGPPSAKQVAQLGLEFGRMSREMSITQAWNATAQIPRVDIRRVKWPLATAIFVRAMDERGVYTECDIATVTCDTLIRFLQARGGRNVFAEAIVLQILGHELPECMRLAPVRPK